MNKIKENLRAYLKHCETLHQQHQPIPRLTLYQGPPEQTISTQRTFAEILSSILEKPISPEDVSITIGKADFPSDKQQDKAKSDSEISRFTQCTYVGEEGYFKSFGNTIFFYSPYYLENKEFVFQKKLYIIIGLIIALSCLGLWLLA